MEPLRALSGSSMGELLRGYVTGFHFLQAIIADSGGSLDRGLDITGLKQVPLLSGVSPDPRKTVSLEFEALRILIGLLRVRLFCLPHLAFDSKKLLHVMSHFMGQHVGFRELTGCPKTLF